MIGRFASPALLRGNRAQRSARLGAYSKTRLSIPSWSRIFLKTLSRAFHYPEGWWYRFVDIPASIAAPRPSTAASVRLECETMPARAPRAARAGLLRRICRWPRPPKRPGRRSAMRQKTSAKSPSCNQLAPRPEPNVAKISSPRSENPRSFLYQVRQIYPAVALPPVAVEEWAFQCLCISMGLALRPSL